MNIYEQVLKPYMRRPQPEENDYRDEEGYLCCGNCHTRREHLIDFDGQSCMVPVACKCRQEQYDREEAARKKEERIRGIEDTLSDWNGQGVAIQVKASFDQDDENSIQMTAKIKGYAANFDRAYENNLGLMLYGQPGTGKTFYAECVARSLIKDGRFAWMTSIRMLSSAMSQNYGENRNAILNRIKSVDLLILDDFGAERDTSFMAEQVFEIINARYESGKPLMVTTNLDPKTMASEKEISARRVYERVMEMCAPIEVKGETRRRQIAARKMADLKDILGLEG